MASGTKRKGSRGDAGRPLSSVNQETFLGRVGARMRELRVAKGLSLEDVVARTNGVVSLASLSEYEQGIREPVLSRYLAICAALGVKLSELLPRDFLDLVADSDDLDEIMRLLTKATKKT